MRRKVIISLYIGGAQAKAQETCFAISKPLFLKEGETDLLNLFNIVGKKTAFSTADIYRKATAVFPLSGQSRLKLFLLILGF